MDHSLAQSIFDEIQARPYNVAVTADEPANNCYYKGLELIQKLGELGYAVRGRIGETQWHAMVPVTILEMMPQDVPVTHFFVEILLDGEWRVLDASFQPALAKFGFPVGGWETGQLCFPIHKLYSQEEVLLYFEKWADEDLLADYFARGRPAFEALNLWFDNLAMEALA